MEEKKNIAITLQEAKEWYKGTNPTLKELALKAFSKEELEKQRLPKTWEEFCEKYSTVDETEYFINSGSQIIQLAKDKRHRSFGKNACASKQEAEAFLALMQLYQLRKAYVKDWEPDWMDDISIKYCIEVNSNIFSIHGWYKHSHVLSFPNCGLAEQFLNNFKDLLEIAKPLL